MNLLETFETLDSAAIKALINQEQEENHQLDFKKLNDTIFDQQDRRNLAKAVSGFANSEGGLIIWGVDARQNDRKIDCAKGLVLIEPLQRAISRLNSLTGECTSPIVSGVQHRAIFFEPDKGCAVTLVPESASGPHMAKLTEDRYYKRSGDSFRKMEHFDLADMFGRRQRPDLLLNLTVSPIKEHRQVTLTFMIVNTGRASAKHSGFHINFEKNIVAIRNVTGPLQNLSDINSGRPTLSFEYSTGVIHPNGIQTLCGSVDISWLDPVMLLTLYIKLFCDGMPMKEFTRSVALPV